MVVVLRITYAVILGIMLYVVSNACMQESLFKIPEVVTSNIWFKATLVDCYFGFLSFFFWVCYREKSILWKVFWFFAIMLTGNIAMAAYVLQVLARFKSGDGVDKLFARAGG